MNEFFPNDTMTELAEKVTLLINNRKMKDNRHVGEYMTPTTTGNDLHPNKIIIEVDKCSPPTMNATERAELAKSCEEAEFTIPGRDMLEFPCVHEIITRSGKGHCGVAILARSGGKAPPRYAILQPPIEEVTKDHDGVKYIYTNLVAILIVKC